MEETPIIHRTFRISAPIIFPTAISPSPLRAAITQVLISGSEVPMAMTVNPIIFVHGIQGSWLKDEYPVDYDNAVVWTGILKKRFDALHLHRLDDSVDTDVNRLIMPHQAVPMIYEGIIDEIRDEMDDQPYAYSFTYDWRKDNRLSARALGEFMPGSAGLALPAGSKGRRAADQLL